MSHIQSGRPTPALRAKVQPSHQTAKEILLGQEQRVKVTKALIKRFPDAEYRNGKWYSNIVSVGNAKNNEVSDLSSNGAILEIFTRIKVGGDIVEVWDPTQYRLTAEHVIKFLEGNVALLMKQLAKALQSQEKTTIAITRP